jgi:hypothetical protein
VGVVEYERKETGGQAQFDWMLDGGSWKAQPIGVQLVRFKKCQQMALRNIFILFYVERWGEEPGTENKRWKTDEAGGRENLPSSTLLALSYQLYFPDLFLLFHHFFLFHQGNPEIFHP